MHATIPDGLDEIGLDDAEFKRRHRCSTIEQAVDAVCGTIVARVNRRRPHAL